jgi:hypothetical protein
MERGNGSRCSDTASGSADTVIAQHGRIVGAGALAARGAHFGEQLKRLFVVAAGDVTIGSKAQGGDLLDFRFGFLHLLVRCMRVTWLKRHGETQTPAGALHAPPLPPALAFITCSRSSNVSSSISSV